MKSKLILFKASFENKFIKIIVKLVEFYKIKKNIQGSKFLPLKWQLQVADK